MTDEKVRGLESSVSALRRECSEKEQKLAGLKKVQKENTSLTSQVSRCVRMYCIYIYVHTFSETPLIQSCAH